MKILYFGAGFVGACSAAVSADSGHDVLVYDINKELIKNLSSFDQEKIESSLFEKGLSEMLSRNRDRIKFTYNIKDINGFIDDTEAVFMCLPTPEKDSTGETNLAFYEQAAKELGQHLLKRNNGEQRQYVLIINKSTVPIEMESQTKEIMDSTGVKNYGVGSNPEFLVEGKAIEGSLKPERIVVGAWNQKDFDIFRKIYVRFSETSADVSYIEVNPREAAAGKLLANYMLFNRLANAYDVVGRVCEKFNDLQYENIKKVLINDSRIGKWGFYNSLFAGGSCFIKDARSLAHQLSEKETETDLVKDVLSANQRQLDNFLARPEKELNFDFKEKTVCLLGLAFKRDSNDIRNSASLGVTEFLFKKDVKEIRAYDPAASQNYLKYFSDNENLSKIKLTKKIEDAVDGVDVVVVATDWPQFREIAGIIKEKLPKGVLIMDGRRMLQHKYEELAVAGYNVIAVGSPTIKAKN
jgi:UDPglucose 6-dehydrogenase